MIGTSMNELKAAKFKLTEYDKDLDKLLKAKFEVHHSISTTTVSTMSGAIIATATIYLLWRCYVSSRTKRRKMRPLALTTGREIQRPRKTFLCEKISSETTKQQGLLDT
ncbi:hypothetical protein RUM43_015124 [Polyplax serrata]|uniref:Uncharacterized protein n=1 Tax=Polyplax serrata TaxID=468196 RepID=A0AAN8NIC8_POLSC